MLKRVQHGRESELQVGKNLYASEHRSLQDDIERGFMGGKNSGKESVR
jgi:hypothetical protein